jgi:hypothetical protein
MRSIEIHLLETASDVDTAIRIGLVEPLQLEVAKCAACSDDVGHVDGVFATFAIAIDERDVPWFVCYECLEDVVDPIAIELTDSTYATLFDDDEEFEKFTLRDDGE